MILIISVCKNKLHELEFVEPVKEIVKKEGKDFFEVNCSQLEWGDVEKADKIIICGTSLQDNNFLKRIQRFRWLKETEKSVLGICAGMQIIGIVFGGKVKKRTEIGYFKEEFNKEFLGLTGEQEVWHLHNNYCSFLREFESFCLNKIPQAVKHREKKIYGVLFHPEVRNKDLIKEFLRI